MTLNIRNFHGVRKVLTKGNRFVNKQSQFVLMLQLNHGFQVTNSSSIHVNSFYNQKSSNFFGQFGILFVIFGLLLQKLAQMINVIVSEEFNLASGSVQGLLNGEIHRFVRKNDVSTFGISWNCTGNRCESIRI